MRSLTEGRSKFELVGSAVCLILTLILIIFSVKPAYALDDWFSVALNPERDYLVVVNEDNPYEFGGEYDQQLQEDLVYISDVYCEAERLEAAAALAFQQLQTALRDEGLVVGLFNGYRTEQDQQDVYDYYANLEGWSETNKVSLPGYSEHHTGLLLNVVILHTEGDEAPIWYTETAERSETIPEFRKLHEMMPEFGFIDRYPAGKEEITGVPSEPYEIRFVGSAEIAHAIQDNNLCLEEYVSKK